MLVSIVIPTYTQWAFTKQCLLSVKQHTPEELNYEVLVVNNAHAEAEALNDPTARECPELGTALFGPRFHYIAQPENRNFAGACNAGAEAAQGLMLFFLNNDTEVTAGWLPPLLQAFQGQENSVLAGVGPLLLFPQPAGLPGTTLRQVQHLGIAFDPSMQPGHLYEYFPENHPLLQKKRRFQAITAAALMTPRTLFLHHRFDEDFRNGYEDVEWCARLGQAGYCFQVEPASVLLHWCGLSPGRNTHSEHNRRILHSCRAWHTLEPDLEEHLQADGYCLQLSPWGMWQAALTSEREQALNARLAQHYDFSAGQRAQPQGRTLAPGILPGLLDWLRQSLEAEPFWVQGHRALIDLLAANGQAAEALAYASQNYRFDASPGILLRVPPLARLLEQDQAVQYATRVLRAFVQSRSGEWTTALLAKAPQPERTPWYSKEYIPFLRQLCAQGVLDSPPLSGAPYQAWLALQAEKESAKAAPALVELKPSAPLFSILMPVYDPSLAHLDAALRSVREQSFANWELCAVDDASPHADVRALLEQHAAEDARIRLIFQPQNCHISVTSNSALGMAQGEFVVLLDNDDLLAPRALEHVAQAVQENPQAALFFSDEDRLDSAGLRVSPFFKSGLDVDLLLACNAISHLGVYRTEIVRRVGAFRPGLEGAQDHDLALRFLLAAEKDGFKLSQWLIHIPKVLYHWRQHSKSTSVGLEAKPYAAEAALKAKRDFLEAEKALVPGLNATLEVESQLSCRPGSSFSHVHFGMRRYPLLSLVIVCLNSDLRCVSQLLQQTNYAKKEVFIAPVGQEVEAELRQSRQFFGPHAGKPQLLPAQPSASQARQAAGLQARPGSMLGFVNAQAVPAQPDWASRLVACAARPHVGVSGARLVRQPGFLVQAGYALGYAPEPWLCPAYAGLHVEAPGYYSQAHLLRSVLAVQSTAFFCQTDLFQSLGGFDLGLLPEAEQTKLALPFLGAEHFVNVDFCLRARELGLRSVIDPEADLYLLPGQNAEPCVPVAHNLLFAQRWAKTLATSPCQSPLLAWCPGGWKFRWSGVHAFAVENVHNNIS